VEFITLTIDGKEVQAPKGSTVLDACKYNGIKIPTLCHDPELSSPGGCRLCIVEIAGMRNLPPSCVTVATQGMAVKTNTDDVFEARKTVLELLVSNHPMDCMTCQKMGNCSLAEYAYEYGVSGDVYGGEKSQEPIDDSNQFIVRDMNKCILCGKCVRVCEEIQVRSVIDFAHRGFDTTVSPALLPLGDSECVYCGSCVAVCPTGALVEKPMCGKGRPWEVSKVKTTCPFCGTGCNFDLNVKDGKVIGVTSNPTSAVNGRHLCVKGRFGTDFIHSDRRITTPLIKKDGEFVEASWDEALDLVATNLTRIKNQYGANAIGALSSARCTNEENYLMQKFMRAVIGTNNVDHCART
jgi:predicted molibdopterin-dependent oxidoreductase YjgC